MKKLAITMLHPIKVIRLGATHRGISWRGEGGDMTIVRYGLSHMCDIMIVEIIHCCFMMSILGTPCKYMHTAVHMKK